MAQGLRSRSQRYTRLVGGIRHIPAWLDHDPMTQSSIACLLASLAATNAATASIVMFQDATMAPGSFSISTIGTTPQQVTSATDAAGGGAIKVKTMSNAAVYTAFARTGWTIAAIDAASAAVDASIDFKVEYAFLQGMGYGLVAMQDGAAYTLAFGTTSQGGTDVGSGWKRRSITGASFDGFTQVGNANARLNLTANGGDITLGFLTGNSAGNGITILYDNLAISLSGVVPGPSGVAAFAGLLVSAGQRRRR